MGEVVEGRHHEGDLEFGQEFDAAIVGSGASGAVCAALLAEAGLRVVILEEGGRIEPTRYGRFRPTETMRHMFRDAGTTTALGLGDTPLISIQAGRTVGGSSTLTGGVIFRIPEPIHEEWVEKHRLDGLSMAQMEPAYLDVERALRVETVPAEMRSGSTRLFGEGAERLGYSIRSMQRNTSGCRGASRCNFGCPHQAKLSVDLNYLPRALAKGAALVSDCKVTRLRIRGDRVVGVEARLVDGEGRSRGRAIIRARKVVLAGSALFTPSLLLQAGVGRRSRQVGRNLTLHPAARVAAIFDRKVDGWKGAMQSAYADAFQDEGITLNSIFPVPSVLAAMMPGIGPELEAYTTGMDRVATFGMMVHDEGGGRVWRLPGGRSLFTYRMHPGDKRRMIKAIRILAETFFAGGAKEVLLPIFGLGPLDDPAQLRLLDDPNLSAKRFECMTFHPLGTARMGNDPAHSVVGATGETHDLKGLFVVDGSVFPTSIGVNSQLPIMAVATKLAWGIAAEA